MLAPVYDMSPEAVTADPEAALEVIAAKIEAKHAEYDLFVRNVDLAQTDLPDSSPLKLDF